MKNDIILYKNTNNIYEDITSIVNQANDAAYKTVNVLLVERNWFLGKRIAEEELKDNRKENYGKEIINELSKKLTNDFGKGFDRTNLYHYLQFYKLYPNFVDSVSRQSILSWTHYRILLQVFSKEARDWYEKEAIAYYNNDYLRNNLIEITTALLNINTNKLSEVVSITDYYKIRSCMTLFYNVSNNKLFKDVLDKYYKGTFDNITLELLNKYDDIEISTTADLEYIHKLLEETLKEHNDYVDDNL